MIEKNINDKKKLNQQQPSFYDNDVFEFDRIINGYYKLIGGDNNNYDKHEPFQYAGECGLPTYRIVRPVGICRRPCNHCHELRYSPEPVKA